MLIKSDLKILRYVYRRQGRITYGTLYRKFSKQRVKGVEEYLRNTHKIEYDQIGHPVPFELDDLPVFLTYEGAAEVESRQWFGWQFIFLQILLPIALAVITTFLTRALFPCQ